VTSFHTNAESSNTFSKLKPSIHVSGGVSTDICMSVLTAETWRRFLAVFLIRLYVENPLSQSTLLMGMHAYSLARAAKFGYGCCTVSSACKVKNL